MAVERAVVDGWSRRGLIACLLWPLSLVYASVFKFRRLLYQGGWMQSRKVNAVVVVVGNVITGGAGKTPTVIAITRQLQLQGRAVGIISRGYGRKSSECLEVQSGSHPNEVGDEPLLLRQTSQVPVFVARDRHAAAQALLAKYPLTQIIVCDDGLQHYALYRDIEVCVFDDRGCGNGWLLPAGPLREPWPRHSFPVAGQLHNRLLVLHTGQHPAFGGYRAMRSLASFALCRDGGKISLDSLRHSSAKPLLALAGIAQPEAFFSMLRALELPLKRTIAFSDHYAFDSFSRNEYGGYTIICTEKDALKLWSHVPDALAIPLEMVVEQAMLVEFETHLSALLEARLSSSHGHQTT